MFTVHSDRQDMVTELESTLFTKYGEMLRERAASFPSGIKTNLALGWKESGNRYSGDKRPPVADGYVGFILLDICDAEGNIIESADGDMYMRFSWMISACVNTSVSIDEEVDPDFLETLAECAEYFADPY